MKLVDGHVLQNLWFTKIYFLENTVYSALIATLEILVFNNLK